MLKNRWIGFGLIGAMLVFSAVIYSRLPARVPIHWNINGVADDYGTRELAALFVPGLSLGLWLLFQILPKLDPLTITSPDRFSYAPFLDTFRRFLNFILLFMAGLHVTTLGIALGWPIHIGQVMMIEGDPIDGGFEGGIDQFDDDHQQHAGDHERLSDSTHGKKQGQGNEHHRQPGLLAESILVPAERPAQGATADRGAIRG